jgi:GNAT superfamily N-acetyltransferase
VDADNSEDSLIWEVMEMALALQRQGGYAPPDYDKIAKDVYATVKQGMTWVARASGPPGAGPGAGPHSDTDAGRAIGGLALEEVPFRYSAETFLSSPGLWVAPAWRGGRVGAALLSRAREEGKRRGKVVMVHITSPDRKPARARTHTEAGMIAQIAGFVPMGYVLRIA